MGRPADLLRRIAGAPLRGVLGRYPWLKWILIGLPILLVLALFGPVLEVVAKGIGLIGGALLPLLDNATGRLVLLNIVLLVAFFVGFRVVRGRVRATLSGIVLRRHLDAVGALVTHDTRRSRELLRKIARARTRAPAAFPAVRQDAMLKLARMDLEEGDVDGAFGWLSRIKQHSLPREFERSLVQLRAECYLAQGEVLPETVERSLQEAVGRFPDDARLLALLRRVVLGKGALEEVAELQARVYKHAAPRQREAEQQRLVEDLVAAGEAALDRGDLARARSLALRARSRDADHPGSGCLLGKIRLAADDLKGAVREWGRTRSPRGLELTAELLQSHPGVLAPREILECSPTEGTLLLVAREYARLGEHRKALRAVRRAARELGPSPSVTAILAEVLARSGREDEAAKLCEDTVLRIVGGDA